MFQFVKKTGPNLSNMLSVLKSLALGKKSGKTVPCNMHSNCKCCTLIGDDPVTEINGHPVRTAPGTCKTKNIIYMVECLLCNKPYVGRTIQILGKRMGGHRECYYQILRNEDVDFSKDDYSLSPLDCIFSMNMVFVIRRISTDTIVSKFWKCAAHPALKKRNIIISMDTTPFTL